MVNAQAIIRCCLAILLLPQSGLMLPVLPLIPMHGSRPMSKKMFTASLILKLKPVTYTERPKELHRIWGTPDSILSRIDHSEIEKMRFIGFLAQDVEKAANDCGFEFPGIDVPRIEMKPIRCATEILPCQW